MIAAELRGGGKPSLNEALGWIGSRVDDVFGSAIGRLEDVWIDPATGEPRWLLVKEGRFGGRSTLIPFDQATPGDENTVWIPYERSVVREAPQIEPGVPLTQQVEATLRNHYAANTAAAVAHGYQSAGREAEQEGPADSRATRATVRLATAGPQPEPGPGPMPPPQLPLRPAPPIDAPPGPERQEEPYGYEPAAEDPPPPPAPFPPPRQPAADYRPPAPGPPQPGPQQPPPDRPEQPMPQEPPRQPLPPEQPRQPYGFEPRVHPQQPPSQPYPQQPPPPVYGYEPQPPAPVALPPRPGARGGYQPPPVQQVPPPTPEPDPLDVLAGLPPGHMVEIELSGSLTISGELRHARVVPPGDPSGSR